MNAKEGMKRVFIACGIIAAVLLVVLVAIPFEHGATFWISYVFVWVALAVLVAVNYYLFKQSSQAKGTLYRSSVVAVSLGYLAAATLASLIFMVIGNAPLWIVFVVHLVLLAGALLLMLGGDTGARLVEADEASTRAQTSFIQSVRTQVASASAYMQDADAKSALDSLAENLRFSDPVSSASVAFIEQQMADQLAQLNAAVSANNTDLVKTICAQIEQTLAQRNAIVRQMK